MVIDYMAITISEVWARTWGVKVLSLFAAVGLPGAAILASVTLPLLLLPLLVLVLLSGALLVLSVWTQHGVHRANRPGYSLERHLYYLIYWGLVHAGIAVAAMVVGYLALAKFAPVAFVPWLGSAALAYGVFLATDTWIVARSAEDIRKAGL